MFRRRWPLYDAVQKNKPLIERVVTVTGRQMEAPKNLLVRFGTPVAVLLEGCGEACRRGW